MKLYIALALLVSLPISLVSSKTLAFELTPHSASYSANIKKGIKIKGNAVRELKKVDEHNWLYTFQVRSFAADIDESVTLTLIDGRLKPSQYSYKLSPMFGRTRSSKLGFDWSSNLVSGLYKKKNWSLSDIPSNSYDSLSYQLQLLRDINQSQPALDYHIVRKAKSKPSSFEVIGKEVLSTKLGEASTLLVKKLRSNDSKRETYIWISEEYPMLLVKMAQTEKDGEKYEIHLEHATVNGKPVSFVTKQNTTP